MKKSDRINLLTATDPRGAKHHQWQIKFNWGELVVRPDGSLGELAFDSSKGVPKELSYAIDELLIQYAKCKINSFELGCSLIKKSIQQIGLMDNQVAVHVNS